MRDTEEVKKILGSIFFGICLMMTLVCGFIALISFNNDKTKIQESRHNPFGTFVIPKETTKPEKNMNDSLGTVFEQKKQ